MKYKSVEELKKHILDEIEDGDIFEEYLFEKYPRLFPTDENGQLLPQTQRCWNDCPKGWMNIVDSLFGCIDDYVQNYVHSKVNPKYRVLLAIRKIYWRHIKNPIFARFNPYEDFQNRLPKGAKFASPSQKELRKIRASWKNKLRVVISKIDSIFFNKKDMYIRYKTPPVTIEQYKEKYATLRIYHSGGDDVVDGMIKYAEYLSTITCQETGEAGQMYKKRNWYARLSKNRAEELGYTLVEE